MRLSSLMFLVLLLVGCTTSTVQQQIQDAVKWYQSNAKPQKALAYGATRSGGGVLGYAEGMPDLESARRKALANCNENGFKANVAVSCVVIYENDDFVGSRSPIL